ncbi:DUF4129 domain-containing protein [Kitasatospora sp. McL0602]|uniref:DUF4129 domain-containing protein n=1 Tax=Kitasatospora sp. McL0602 TaxID=3439530 RepID=UPI003F891916
MRRNVRRAPGTEHGRGRLRGRGRLQLRLRAALAALAAGGLALAALALRPVPGERLWHAGGVLGVHRGLRVLLILGCIVGGAVLTGRHRRGGANTRSGDDSPAAERLASAANVLLPIAAAAVPLLLLLLPNHHVTPPPRGSLSLPGGPPETPSPTASPSPSAPPPPVDRPHGRFDPQLLLTVLGTVLVVAVAVVGLVALWRRFGHLLRAPAHDAIDPAGAAPMTGAALADAVADGRRALHGDDARAAVIACYAAMTASLAASGVTGRAADTPSDLLDRAAAGGLLGTGPQLRNHPQTLAALFREARYSSHPMTDDHLLRARAALDAIAAQLPATVPSEEPQPTIEAR